LTCLVFRSKIFNMLTKSLNKVGALIALVLLVLFIVNLVIVLFQFMVLESITLDECLLRIVLFMIPTEVTIVETFAAVPIVAVIALLFYVRYVKG
jgi:hypothetical protein